MKTLNDIGEELGKYEFIRSMTDITGFGLLGHLIEMCEGSGVSAEILFDDIPRFENIGEYIIKKSYPGGTMRNFKSYGHKVSELSEEQKILLCDPQTSGGLLVALDTSGLNEFMDLTQGEGLDLTPIGRIVDSGSPIVNVK
jgi:selenide,water dikinase